MGSVPVLWNPRALPSETGPAVLADILSFPGIGPGSIALHMGDIAVASGVAMKDKKPVPEAPVDDDGHAEKTAEIADTAEEMPVKVRRLTDQSVSQGDNNLTDDDEAKVVETRKLVNEVARSVSLADLAATYSIGDHVITTYFIGSYKDAVNSNGHKGLSLRKLSRAITAEDCEVKRSWVTDAVHLEAQRRMLPADKVEGVGKGIMQALLLVSSVEEKVRWLEVARKDGLGANELRRKIREAVPAKKRAPEPWSTTARKTMEHVCNSLQSLLDSEVALDPAREDPADAGAAVVRIQDAMVTLKTLSGKLDKVRRSAA